MSDAVSAGQNGGRSTRAMHALTLAAVEVAGAETGWMLLRGEAGFEVLTIVGDTSKGNGIGNRVATRPIAGAAGLAAASGQPVAISPREGDDDNRGAGGSSGLPSAVLAVPCVGSSAVGVLELARTDGAAFDFDALELVAILGEVGGAALDDWRERPSTLPDPADVSRRLGAAARADPTRYADVVRTIGWMLG